MVAFLSTGLLLMGLGPTAQAEEEQGDSASTLNDCIEIHPGIPPGVSVDPWKCESNDPLPPLISKGLITTQWGCTH